LLDRGSAEAMLRATWETACGPLAPPLQIEMCVCSPDADCPRRKLQLGMLLAIWATHRIAPERALYVRDLPIDELAAQRAGVKFRWAKDFFG